MITNMGAARLGGLWLTLDDLSTADEALEVARRDCAKNGNGCGCSKRFAKLAAKVNGPVTLPEDGDTAEAAVARGQALLDVARSLYQRPAEEAETVLGDAVADLLHAAGAADVDPFAVVRRALAYLVEEEGDEQPDTSEEGENDLEAVPCPQCGPGAPWRLELEDRHHADVAGFRCGSGGGLVAVVDGGSEGQVDTCSDRIECVKCGHRLDVEDWEYDEV